MSKEKKKECKHGFLLWVGDGDKRLFCKKCKSKFVVVDGDIKPIRTP